MKQSKLKEVKKVLMSNMGYIRMGKHVKVRMLDRGYTKGDIVKGILSGQIVEVQWGFNDEIERSTFNYVIMGKDTSDNSIVVILSEEGKHKFKIITVMPPTDHRRFKDCV